MPPKGDSRETIQSLKGHFRSGRDDLGRDFFLPCLRSCSRYRRAAAYFSSSALATWAEILPELIHTEVITIQLLISPNLSKEDCETLRSVATEEDRQRIRQELADRIVEEAIEFAKTPQDRQIRRNLLAWMIATGKLDLRIVFAEHVEVESLFHEKIGVFNFPWGDSIAFTGSANETIAGHSVNYESIDVFRSWLAEDALRVQVKESQFDEAWHGTAPGLSVLSLSPAAIERIKVIAAKPYEAKRPEDSEETQKSDTRWRHQGEAIDTFLEKERGIFEMATGTGKTRTALRICEKLINENRIDSIIISADGNDLLDQWYTQVVSMCARLTRRFGVRRHYRDLREREYFLLDPSHTVLLTTRYFLPPALAHLKKDSGQKTLLIHDEVHRLGSPGNIEQLSGKSDLIRFRLGLSATPEREYDEIGTKFVATHVGPVIYRFDLADAIRRGILAPFNYFAIEWQADDQDRERIKQVYKKAAARKAAGDPMGEAEIWTEIARVYKTSKVKVPLFHQFIAEHVDLLKRCIIFVETKEFGDDILEIVHRYRFDFHTYFAEDQSETLRRFARGELECLITCHRLSEGIDIQSLTTVILLSSDRARLETIQRIGRCLRTDPKNVEKRANIVDFIRTNHGEDVGGLETADMERRRWLTELSNITPESI